MVSALLICGPSALLVPFTAGLVDLQQCSLLVAARSWDLGPRLGPYGEGQTAGALGDRRGGKCAGVHELSICFSIAAIGGLARRVSQRFLSAPGSGMPMRRGPR